MKRLPSNWRRAAVLALLVSASLDAVAAPRVTLRSPPPKPAFNITPLTHEFNALPGQELSFEFVVSAAEKNVELEVGVVSLRQEITGLIQADEQPKPVANIRLLTGRRLHVRRGESEVVKGRWQLPLGSSGYHTVGITLTDVTKRDADAPRPVDHGGAGACVRFVTRYLLRMGATVGGGSLTAAPEVVAGALVDQQGRAVATALLQAGDDAGGVWRVRGQIFSDQGPLGQPFALRLPTRVNLPAAEGEKVHVLAATRVLTVAAVREPLFPGRYELEVSVSRGSLPASKKRFELVVEPEDFPAQRTVVAEVVRQIEVTPNQIELSTAAGGARIVPLSVVNRSRQAVSVRLAANAGDDQSPEWLVVRPDQFVLRPASTRRVMVAVRGGGRRDADRYAWLRVAVAPSETTAGGAHRLPVALLAGNQADELRWEVGDAAWSAAGSGGVMSLPLANEGARRLAPRASLTLTDNLDRQIKSRGGFGRWLLPGATDRLSFKTPALPPGEYHAEIEFTPAPGHAAERVSQKLVVPPKVR